MTDTNEVATIPSQSNEVSSVMNVIAEAAKDPTYDVAKLKELIALKNDMQDREAKIAFGRDYAPMKAELPLIVKNKRNDHTKSGYADLANINEVVDPILGKHGFATSTKIIEQTATHITARAELIHKAGHREEMTLTMPLDTTGGGAKNGVQSIASTITYLKRVAKCALLDIAAGDDDTDGNTISPFITIEQAVDIDNQLRELGGNIEVFLQHLEAKNVLEILAKNYKRAMSALADKRRKLKNEQTAKAAP